jgi:hypothetical protein
VATSAATTSDPPVSTGPSSATGVSPATGSTDPLTTAISPSSVLGSQDQASPRFLHGAGTTAAGSGEAGTGASGHGRDLLIRAGTGFVPNFSVAHGDTLDLTKLLAGAPLAHDLTNIDRFVQVLGSGPNDPGFGHGTKTMLEVTGPGGTAIVNLEGAGKLDLKDLLKHNSLLLPPH